MTVIFDVIILKYTRLWKENSMSSLKEMAKTLAKILASALGGGSANSSEVDPTDYLKGMEDDADEIFRSYGDDQKFEKAISLVIKEGIGMAVGAPGASVNEKLKSAIPEMSNKMPDILEKSGLDKLISDYNIKDPKVLDSKINSVVSKFTDKSMSLGGVAAGFSGELGKYISDAVPKTPMQKSGLIPDADEISQSLDRQHQPKQEYKNDSINNGPSPR